MSETTVAETTTKAKHTAGPWVLDARVRSARADQDKLVLIDTPEFAFDIHFGPGVDDAVILANGCLIAGAPEMLAALKQIEAEMSAGFGSSYGETREQVRRAIAKAESR